MQRSFLYSTGLYSVSMSSLQISIKLVWYKFAGDGGGGSIVMSKMLEHAQIKSFLFLKRGLAFYPKAHKSSLFAGEK